VVQLNGVALGSGTLSGNAVVTLGGGSEVAGAALTNQGSLVVLGSNQFNGTFTNDVTGTLQVRGTSNQGSGTLTLTNGFTNNGLVELVGIGNNVQATLSVTSGPLTNAAGAVINVPSGFSGPRTLNAQLDNQGTLNVNNAAGLTVTHPNGSPAITNSGTINVSDGDLTLNQSGTTAVFLNTGTLNVSPGCTLFVNGGEFDPDSGTINGSMRLNGVALGSGTLSGNAVVTLSPGSQPAGSTLVNQGQLFVQGGTSTFNGSFTNGENGLLQLRAGVNNTTAVLTVANGLTNNGVIQLIDIAGNSTVVLNVTNGTLTNAPGALLETLPGSGGFPTLNAQLDNQGTLNLNQRLNINRTGAAHTNSGVITVRADLTVSQLGGGASFDNTGTINALTGNVLFTQTGAQPSFSNGGEIDVAAGAPSPSTAARSRISRTTPSRGERSTSRGPSSSPTPRFSPTPRRSCSTDRRPRSWTRPTPTPWPALPATAARSPCKTAVCSPARATSATPARSPCWAVRSRSTGPTARPTAPPSSARRRR
jgi:hypothetical protein